MNETLNYEQPQKYIVSSAEYESSGIPVLTAGQSFVLGYSNDKIGVKKANKKEPVIIFDDFMTTSHFVDFDFKIKSSAIKLLSNFDKNDNLYFNYLILNNIKYSVQNHERHWISKFSNFDIDTTNIKEKNKIANLFHNLSNLITLHQRKYEKLKNIKKSLLDKMFV